MQAYIFAHMNIMRLNLLIVLVHISLKIESFLGISLFLMRIISIRAVNESIQANDGDLRLCRLAMRSTE